MTSSTPSRPKKAAARAKSKSPSNANAGAAKTKVKKAAKRVGRADRAITHKAARFRDRPLMKVFAAFCEAADQPPLIAASAGTLAIGLASRRADLTRGGARMLASHLIATGAKLAIKHQFDRTRPREALAHGHRFKKGDEGGHDEKSFPSGHTAGAVAVAHAAAAEIDGAAVPATLAAAAVAAGQAPAGNHYLSDVLAGAVIGYVADVAVGALFDRFEPKNETTPLAGGKDAGAIPATATPRPT